MITLFETAPGRRVFDAWENTGPQSNWTSCDVAFAQFRAIFDENKGRQHIINK